MGVAWDNSPSKAPSSQHGTFWKGFLLQDREGTHSWRAINEEEIGSGLSCRVRESQRPLKGSWQNKHNGASCRPELGEPGCGKAARKSRHRGSAPSQSLLQEVSRTASALRPGRELQSQYPPRPPAPPRRAASGNGLGARDGHH